MRNYKELLKDILDNGVDTEDRTGVGTISVFGRTLRWDVSHQFPAVTTKRLAWKAVVGELLWFMEGGTNVDRLRELTHGSMYSEKKTIWDANYENQAKSLGYENGELGPVYGAQWRDWLSYDSKGNVDQLEEVIRDIKRQKITGKHNRRLLVSAWNPAEIPHMALPPCHYSFQFYLKEGKYLSLLWNQRSVDSFLGLPFNIASYALLLNIVAAMTGTIPEELIFSGGDCHIYKNHLSQVSTLVSREERDLPTLKMSKAINEHMTLHRLKNFTAEDFELEGYNPHGTIKAPMAV